MAGSGTTQQINVTVFGETPTVGITQNATADGQAILGTSHVDTLGSGDFTNDFLIGNGGLDVLNGGAGIDNFVKLLWQPSIRRTQPPIPQRLTTSQRAPSNILVDVADVSGNMGASQLINPATQFTSGSGDPTAGSWAAGADKFYYDTTNHNVWYSADGTVNHQVELAHLSTGITAPQAAAAIHVF